jgi:hypothetical protein
MPDTYRVTIVRENSDGDEFESETLFEVAGKIGMIIKIAPGALLDALTEANDGEDIPVALVERVMSSAVAALPATHPFGEQAPQPRKRRTKQQIAEDKMRDEQAARIAAGDAGQVSAPAAVPATVPSDVPADVPVTAADVPTEPATAPVVTTTFEGAAPVSPGGEQYNPFAI